MILRPTKHSHPDSTVINTALRLLVYLKKNRFEDFEVLRKEIKSTISGGEILFLPALNFLYLFGLIEYRLKNDLIEFVGPHEII